MVEPTKSCFVLMPIGNSTSCTEAQWKEVFNHTFKAAIEGADLGYSCHRSSATSGNIIKQILNDIKNADVVIADLTDQNPNVFYELGVRHAITNRTILVAQNEDHIPFDLRPYAYHIYDWTTEGGRQDFAKRISVLLTEIETNPGRSDNPVSDFLETDNLEAGVHSGNPIAEAVAPADVADLELIFGLTQTWDTEIRIDSRDNVPDLRIHMGVANVGTRTISNATFGIGIFPQNGPTVLPKSFRHAEARKVSYTLPDGYPHAGYLVEDEIEWFQLVWQPTNSELVGLYREFMPEVDPTYVASFSLKLPAKLKQGIDATWFWRLEADGIPLKEGIMVTVFRQPRTLAIARLETDVTITR